MDKLRDMAAFVGVVDAKTFTAAADRMDVSKSVLSRRLAALEERLGVRLLNRTTRRLGLTEAGRAYYDRCVRILAEVEDSEQAVSSLNAEPRGVIRLNAPVSFGVLHLAPAIAAFMDRFPLVDIDLVLNDRFVDLIDEGYDMAVRIGTLADSSLIARKLAVSRRVVCASPAYLARRPAPVHPRDLADHACILYRNPALNDQWSFRGADGEPVTVRVRGRICVNNGDMMRDIAVAGQGLVLLPTFLVADWLNDRRLVPLMCDYRPDDDAVYAVYPHNRHLSTKVRAFVDFLARRFGPSPYWDAPLDAAGAANRPGTLAPSARPS